MCRVQNGSGWLSGKRMPSGDCNYGTNGAERSTKVYQVFYTSPPPPPVATATPVWVPVTGGVVPSTALRSSDSPAEYVCRASYQGAASTLGRYSGGACRIGWGRRRTGPPSVRSRRRERAVDHGIALGNAYRDARRGNEGGKALYVCRVQTAQAQVAGRAASRQLLPGGGCSYANANGREDSLHELPGLLSEVTICAPFGPWWLFSSARPRPVPSPARRRSASGSSRGPIPPSTSTPRPRPPPGAASSTTGAPEHGPFVRLNAGAHAGPRIVLRLCRLRRPRLRSHPRPDPPGRHDRRLRAPRRRSRRGEPARVPGPRRGPRPRAACTWTGAPRSARASPTGSRRSTRSTPRPAQTRRGDAHAHPDAPGPAGRPHRREPGHARHAPLAVRAQPAGRGRPRASASTPTAPRPVRPAPASTTDRAARRGHRPLHASPSPPTAPGSRSRSPSKRST